MLEQPGDHACSEWNGMIRVVWWEEWLWRKDCYWCQAATAMWMVAATRSSTLHNDAGLNLFLLFSFLFRFLIVWWWKVKQCCLCKYYNDSQCMCLYWNSYFLLQTQNNFFYFLFDASYYIAFHTLVAPNIMFNFHWCCMLQSFSCVLRLLFPMHITVILAVLLKSAILMPKNSMCPI